MWTIPTVEELFPGGFCTIIRRDQDNAPGLQGPRCPKAGMMEQNASNGSRFVMIGPNPAKRGGVEAE